MCRKSLILALGLVSRLTLSRDPPQLTVRAVGLWAIDFADEFPEAEVTGTDISPIQPTWIPPNLKL